DSALALRLLDFLPHPLSRRPVWRGVHETGAGNGLALPVAAPGTAAVPGPREHRWWEPPPGELPLAEGARRVGEAIAASVRAHVGGLDRISCELSGGLDSTALAFAARESGPASLSLLTVAARDRYSEDETWARRAVEAARGMATSTAPVLDHHVIPAADAPYFYADLASTAAELNDEPLPVAPGRARAE
ncbi:asparagine synthase, partial [Streptomyces sp. SID7982]|nr:asparagine synthase [Streptomyces sp. SID7982]